MFTFVRIAVFALGLAIVVATLLSATKTFVLPRAARTQLTRTVFRSVRWLFDLRLHWTRDFAVRDRWLALYAPLALLMLPVVWLTNVLLAYTAMFWALGVTPWRTALATSGSSLLTLGFVRPPGTWRVFIAFVEAGIGLGIISLMISYLPTIYGAFSRREALVGMLEVRAGLSASPAVLLTRYSRIEWLDRIGDDLFEPWEQWFADVEESHTSHASLVYFRSPHPQRSWITAAGCVLDSAALFVSVVDKPYDGRGPVVLRGGFLCLRRIADFYGIAYDPDPPSDAPISVSRREFDLLCVELHAAGVPLKADRDRAWADFAGWRVNYDAPLIGLCELVMAPPALWSSDRMPSVRSPR